MGVVVPLTGTPEDRQRSMCSNAKGKITAREKKGFIP